jgi:L-fuculose-phosphate aldolase
MRREIVTVCRRLYECGLIAGPDGNVSVRIAPDRVLVTPSGMSKVDVTEADLVEVRLTGERVQGEGRPSSEVAVHLRIYAQRADVMAVVHAHPPIATGFAVAGQSLDAHVLPELICQIGCVPLVPYDTPGTQALAERFDPFVASHDAFLMANHGAVTTGPTLPIAHQRMESLEHAARILLTARLLGRVNELPPASVAELLAVRDRGNAVPRTEKRDTNRRSSR